MDSIADDKKLFEGLEDSELLKPGEQPNFTWLRDGKPFDPEDRFKVIFQVRDDICYSIFKVLKKNRAY